MQYDIAVRLKPHQGGSREGYLVCTDCPIAAVGGREYLPSDAPDMRPGANGKVLVYRDSTELFSPETIASFEGKPVTLGHPPLPLLTPETWKQYAVGHLQNVRRGSPPFADSLLADLHIQDESAVKAVLSGEADELSIGFSSQTDEVAPGIARESHIVGNHVAIVPKGRAGALVAIRQDAKASGGIMGFFTRKDADPAGGGEGGTTAPADDIAAVLTAIQEKLSAFDTRLAALEKGGAAADADPNPDDKKDPPANPEDKKDADGAAPDGAAPVAPASGLTAAEVVKIVTEQLKAKDEGVKADAAIVADAAVVAPALDKDTPNLAMSALAEYAKSNSGARLLAAYGGLSKIKADAAPAVLKAAAVHEKCRQDEAASSGLVRHDGASQKSDFFAKAAKLWK